MILLRSHDAPAAHVGVCHSRQRHVRERTRAVDHAAVGARTHEARVHPVCRYPHAAVFDQGRCTACAVPSSSMLSDPRRWESVPSSTTVQPGVATRSPSAVRRKPRCPWRFEIAFQAVDRSPRAGRRPAIPGRSTTVVDPAGAGTASRLREPDAQLTSQAPRRSPDTRSAREYRPPAPA